MSQAMPQEIIVVEGRDDTKRLIETFGPTVKTIETGGSALEAPVLAQIVEAARTHGIIVLTDPDYQGERLRRLVTQAVPSAKQAHISRAAAFGGQGKCLGVEHASPQEIRQALSQVMTPVEGDLVALIPMGSLAQWGLTAGPGAKERRQAVSQHFNLGYTNAKQLQRQLQRYGIDQASLGEFIQALDQAQGGTRE